jgi:hypothetical protein
VERVFKITVNDVNEAPTLSVPGAQTAYEDVDLAFTDRNRNAITVGDPEGGSLTVTLKAAHGKLTLRIPTGLTVKGNRSAAVSLSGSLAALNEQAADLRGRVDALRTSGAQSPRQAGSLKAKLTLTGPVVADIGKVNGFLNEVRALLRGGALTRSQADALLEAGRTLLLSLSRRPGT